jgi:hypothetical protein
LYALTEAALRRADKGQDAVTGFFIPTSRFKEVALHCTATRQALTTCSRLWDLAFNQAKHEEQLEVGK